MWPVQNRQGAKANVCGYHILQVTRRGEKGGPTASRAAQHEFRNHTRSFRHDTKGYRLKEVSTSGGGKKSDQGGTGGNVDPGCQDQGGIQLGVTETSDGNGGLPFLTLTQNVQHPAPTEKMNMVLKEKCSLPKNAASLERAQQNCL